MCKDFAKNFGDKRTGYCITIMHPLTFPSSLGNFFTKNNITVVPHHPTHLAWLPANFLFKK
jgi:hypothetical protein